jgi:glycosyltransferase involved in cell wall biosynthesis
MRVRFISSLERGGPVEQTIVLAGALVERGVDVGVACASDRIAMRVRAVGAEAAAIPLRSPADLAGGRRVWRYARGADVVHAQDRRSGLWVRLGPRPRQGGLRLYTVHGLPDEFLPPPVAASRGLRARLAYPGLDATLCRRADAVIVPSRAIAERLIADLRFPRGKIVVIPNGVSIPAHPRTGGERVGTVTTLEPVKALDVFLRAAARLARERAGLGFAIYGNGSERERLLDLGHELSLADRLEMPGAVEREVAFGELAVFVLSSYMENCPMALLEAMAAGVPAVATSVGGVPEIAHGVVRLVAPGDEDGLAAAVSSLLDDPDAARSQAEAARERVAEIYSSAANADATLGLYERLLGSSR